MRYATVENDAVVGAPHAKPAKIEISPGVIVGAGHWPDAELAKYGEYPISSTFDPAIEYETGYTFDAATGQVVASVAAIAVAEKIAPALMAVDAAAERSRLAYITPGNGQAMSYREKAAQAMDCLANYTAATPPASGVYVLLDSEVGIMANADGTITANAYEVAVVVDATRTAWLAIEAVINRTRVQAKADIKAATTAAEVEAILAAIVWT